MANLSANAKTFLAAHTAPFMEPASWGGVLPRIPDGAYKSTQVVQFRFQSTVTTDADGELHVIVPGDPFKSKFPIITSNMCMRATESTYTAPASDPAPPVAWQAEALPGEPSPNLGAAPNFGNRPKLFKHVLAAITSEFQNSFPGYIEQLSGLVKQNSAYRIIGGGSRIWSLQGELQDHQGIIRAATLDKGLFDMNFEFRTPQAVCDVVSKLYTGNTTPSALTLATVTNIQESFPAWQYPNLSGVEAPFGSQQNPASDSPYGGFMYALQVDVKSGSTGDPFIGDNKLFKAYLKQAAEASEHAWSYKIFDGREGVSGRLTYAMDKAPFQTLRPAMLLYPTNFVSMNTNCVVATTKEGCVHALQITPNGLPTGTGPYECYMHYDVASTGASGWPTGLAFGQAVGGGNFAFTETPKQTIGLIGLDEVSEGWMDPLDDQMDYVDGYHFECTSFQPNTKMYFEHVITIEVVPNQQQTGVMSADTLEDPGFATVIALTKDLTAFPAIVKGHSFWSSFKHAFHKAAGGLGKLKKFGSSLGSYVKSHVSSIVNDVGMAVSFIPLPGFSALGSAIELGSGFIPDGSSTQGGDGVVPSGLGPVPANTRTRSGPMMDSAMDEAPDDFDGAEAAAPDF